MVNVKQLSSGLVRELKVHGEGDQFKTKAILTNNSYTTSEARVQARLDGREEARERRDENRDRRLNPTREREIEADRNRRDREMKAEVKGD